MWQVLVVEDDAQTRDFFANSVDRCDQLQLAASYGTVSEANAWLDRNAASVDVLLTDLGLPDGSGLDVIRHVMHLNPKCEVLVISMFGDEANVLASIEAGALGYIHKDATPENVAQTILQMRAGASPISPMIARRVLEKYKSDKIGREIGRLDSALVDGPLSPREQQTLTLISQGLSYAEIARLQFVSVHTVQTHIKNLYRKLSVHSRGEAVYKAQNLGFLKVQ